jgi:hypothetical protein
MGNSAGGRQDVADNVLASLTVYRKEPSPFLLLQIVTRLRQADDPGAAAAAAGISGEWLREQGELVARMSRPAVLNACSSMTLQELRTLRRQLPLLEVTCDGWAVSEEEIAGALLRYAKNLYQNMVSRMSPYDGWELLGLLAGGWVPSLDPVAPGALDVTAGYAVRFVQEKLAGDDDLLGAHVLERLLSMLPGLGPAVAGRFRRAGIPADQAGLEHAVRVIEVRHYWQQCLSGQEDDGLVLALACAPLLAEQTVSPAEIGTTSEDAWAWARAWVAGQVRQIQEGNYEAATRFSTFTSWSRLGYETFGISAGQVTDWEEAQARDRWTRAQAGDGRAAFHVITHCEAAGNSYERTTGLPRAQARAALQETMNGYAAGLRRQVETAATRNWARRPYRELRSFAQLVRVVNEHASRQGGRPLADTPWDMPPAAWHDFYERYAAPEPAG